jgi:outer membrane PBP1 activator LpoA protein
MLITGATRHVYLKITMPGMRQIKITKRLANVLLFVFIITCSFTSCSVGKTNKTSANQFQQEIKANQMKTLLIVGINPHTIDFTNPELPKGLSREMIEKGIKATLEKLTSMGYEAELFLIDTGTADLSNLAKQLKDKHYSGIVIGNGIRSQTSNFILFEQIINVVHANAPESKIIFNTLPTNTDEAVKRWL